MTSRYLSLVALPISLVGHLVFWAGSANLLRGAAQFRGGIDVLSFVFAIVGILVILAAVATVAIGSLGAYIIGAIHLLFSVALHVIPFDPLHGGFSPAVEVMNGVRGVSMEVSDGMFYYFPPGVGAVTGGIFLAAAFAADRRRAGSPGSGVRAVSAASGLVGLVGLVLAIAFGAQIFVSILVTLRGAAALDVVLLYLGVVLITATLVAARWSSSGALVAGAIASVAGVAGLAAPGPVSAFGRAWQQLGRGLDVEAPSGALLLIGLLLVVAGLAVRVRARRLTGPSDTAMADASEPPPPAGPPSV